MPEILDYLEEQLRAGQFGFSPGEMQQMLERVRRQLGVASQARFGQAQSSLLRRGMLSSGQAIGLSSDISASFAKGLGPAATDIQLESANVGRQRQQWLEGLITQISEARRREEQQRKMANRAGLFKFLGTGIGTAAGFLLGGPPGAVAGAQLGGRFQYGSDVNYDFDPQLLNYMRGLNLERGGGGG
jgi:hypothetical protein